MMTVESDISPFGEVRVQGVCIDTRKITPGNLFIPFKGENTDGHQYAEQAVKAGAAAVMWQQDVPNPPVGVPVLIVKDTLSALQELAAAYREELTLKVVGVTGSNGKTTTKDIAAAIMGHTYKVQKTEGNFNNHIGLPLTILGLEEDTDIAVLEMGMSALGEISLLTKIAKPDAAIITNIGEAHLQDLGSREAISRAKMEITEGLPDGGLLIYPGEEPLLKGKVQSLSHIRTCTFGKEESNDLYPAAIVQKPEGSEFSIARLPGVNFHMPIAGLHNIMNALAAIGAALELQMRPEEIAAGLERVKLSRMRMEWLDGLKGTRILNDAYNASPTAMRAVIGLVGSLGQDRETIVVLGDMLELGEQEEEYHLQLGRDLNPDHIKYVYTYGKLARKIAEGALEQFPARRVFAFEDKTALIESIKENISGNEIILVKASRGMKLEEAVEALALE